MAIERKVRADKLEVVLTDSSRYDLRELIGKIMRENLHELIDWGKPVGKEDW